MTTYTTEQYSLLCDLLYRRFLAQGCCGVEDDDGLLHTSREARAAASAIAQLLGLTVVPSAIPPDPVVLRTPHDVRAASDRAEAS